MVILTTFPPPDEGVRHKQENTNAYFRDRNIGAGTIFIAESRLSWVGSNGQGFSLEYPSISVHAISRDTSNFPHECLYMMVEANLDAQEQQQDNSSNSDDDDSDISNITEVRFVPDDKGSIATMYEAMTECQSLHPDENDSFSGDDDDYYDGSNGPGVLTASAQRRLEGMERVFEEGTEPEPVVGRSDHFNGVSTEDCMETEDTDGMGQFDDAGMAD